MLLLDAAPDFNDPLALLGACHRRIEAFCTVLLRLPSHLREHGADEEAQRAALRVLRYFDSAGRDHHRDEDEDLFPLLQRRAAERGEHAVADVLRDLDAEHRAMERTWNDLAPGLRTICDGRQPHEDELPIKPFTYLYRRHIEVEEDRVLRFAREVLGDGDLAALGRAMARRRGVAELEPAPVPS